MADDGQTKWRAPRSYVSVTIELDEFTPEQLLQGLIDRGYLTEDMALAIVKERKTASAVAVLKDRFAATKADLELAEDELRRGRRHEALIHIERFLGREWVGQLAWS